MVVLFIVAFYLVNNHDDSKKDIYPADDVNEFVKDTVIHSMDIMEKYGDNPPEMTESGNNEQEKSDSALTITTD